MKRSDFQIFLKANLETGLIGGSVDILQRKIRLKTPGPAHVEVYEFLSFFLVKNGKN
jgi:hypothetical protein